MKVSSKAEVHVEVADQGGYKSQKVFSVALADAVAKDNPQAWSLSMIRLYLVIVFVTLGKSAPPNQTSWSLPIYKKLAQARTGPGSSAVERN